MSQHKLFIGLRGYLTGDNADELELQCLEAKKFFPDSHLVVALCGLPAGSTVNDIADEVVHYSDRPLGLTRPFHLLVERAKSGGFDRAILTDGDSQHMFSEIRRMFDSCRADVIVPTRKKKSLIFSDGSDMDRIVMEELENAFFRVKTGCMLIRDPQPGLVLLMNRKALECLNLENVPSMLGDLAITRQLFENGFEIRAPEIDTRVQEKTRVSLERELGKIRELEGYFGMTLGEVVGVVKEEPERFFIDGEKLAEVDRITLAFSSQPA